MPIVRNILSEYIEKAMEEALYDKLEDGTFAGRIPSCKGDLAFGTTLRQCEDDLRSTLEDWILVGLKLKHQLPVIGGIDLNKEPSRESVDTMQIYSFSHEDGSYNFPKETEC
jgi:predicted RNase H-like HicB family nuclease